MIKTAISLNPYPNHARVVAGIASSGAHAPSDLDNGRTIAATQFAGAIPKLGNAEGRGSRSVNVQAIQRQRGADESDIGNDRYRLVHWNKQYMVSPSRSTMVRIILTATIKLFHRTSNLMGLGLSTVYCSFAMRAGHPRKRARA